MLTSSIISSIGVISASRFKDRFKRQIRLKEEFGTAGKNKSTLDPFKEEKEEDIKRLKTIQLELHEDFIKVVQIRGSKLKDPEKNNIFTGEFWTEKTSLKVGLIDGLEMPIEEIKEKFGEKVIIKTFEKPKGFIAKNFFICSRPSWKLVNLIEEKSRVKIWFIDAVKKLKK